MYMHLIGRYLIHDLLKFNVNWLSNYVLSQDSVSRCMFVSVCAYSREVVFSCLHAGCGGS